MLDLDRAQPIPYAPVKSIFYMDANLNISVTFYQERFRDVSMLDPLQGIINN